MRGLSIVVAAVAYGTKVRGVADVITMLEKMLKDNQANSAERNKIYDDEACECKDRLTTLEHQFRDQQSDLTKARDERGTTKTAIDELTTELDFFVRTELDGSEEEKAVNLKYLREKIDTEKGDLAAEQASCNKKVADCDAMMKACDQVVEILKGEGGKPTVVDMVRTLREKALKRKANLQGSEGQCGAVIRGLEKSIGSDETSYKLSMENAAELSRVKDQKTARFDELNEQISELNASQKTVRDEVIAKDDFCKQTKETFDADSDLLVAEIKGLKGAIAALKRVPTNPVFLQIADMKDNVESAISRIAGTALTAHSQKLSALALRIRAKHQTTREAADFFADVRGMIKEMWEKLEQEALDEATREQTCKTDLSDALDAKQAGQRDFDAATTDHKTAILDLKNAQQHLADKEKAMADAQKSLDSENANMAELVEFNTQKRADKEAGVDGLKTALEFLEEVYGQTADSGESYGSRKNMGTDVLTKLNTILAEYKCDFNHASSELACSTGATQYKVDGNMHACDAEASVREGECTIPKSETFVTREDITSLETEIGAELEPQSGLHKDITDGKADVASKKKDVGDRKDDKGEADKTLDAAKKNLKLVQKTCTNQADQFKARVEQREQEIQALKDALEILEAHSKNSEAAVQEQFMFLAKK